MTPIGLAPPPDDVAESETALAQTGAAARPMFLIGSRRARPDRFPAAFWISCAVHAAALALLVVYLRLGPESIPQRMPAEETVQYFDLVLPGEVPQEVAEEVVGSASPASPDGGGAVDTSGAAAPGPAGDQPPSAVPTQGGGGTVPATPSGGGGGGSVGDRLRPGFSDPRLYSDPQAARLRQPGPSNAQRYQEHIHARIEALNDSLYGRSGPDTDWTVKDGSGKRWGISEEGVHLGPLTIPRALVPFPAASGTNQDLEQAREERRQKEEIDRQEADRERRKALEERNEAARQRREETPR